jgi:hypothetical protein
VLVADDSKGVNLAAPLDGRRQHHVHDTDAGDERRCGPDTDEERVDLCEQLENLLYIVLEVADGIPLF